MEDYGYRELYVRWFEQGVFLPMFRSHGTDTPREVWNFGRPGEPFYDALVKNIELRYRLMPYIYSNAARIWTDDYTMMRSLLFDFAQDKRAAALGDEYMFGDSLLVCPVTEPMYYERESRAIDREKLWNCYLPAGTKWYDFHTLKEYEGGTEVEADASIDHIPVFVKAGAVIPMEQKMRYADEAVDTPFEIHIYPGADGSFVLYDSQTGLWKIYRPELAVQRFSPASTFKIYSALHGLEKGIISPESSSMKWDGTPCAFPRWEQDQTLDSAMKDSVNWYFQNIDQLLGRTEISSFLKKINYGNKQISKDLKLYWADDSLKISAVEQVELLQNFYTNTFDCSEQNIQAVKDALRVGEFSGRTLYGKTGTIRRNGRDISGWFVGFVETDDNVLYFAANIQGVDHADGSQAAAITRSVLSSKIFL